MYWTFQDLIQVSASNSLQRQSWHKLEVNLHRRKIKTAKRYFASRPLCWYQTRSRSWWMSYRDRRDRGDRWHMGHRGDRANWVNSFKTWSHWDQAKNGSDHYTGPSSRVASGYKNQEKLGKLPYFFETCDCSLRQWPCVHECNWIFWLNVRWRKM